MSKLAKRKSKLVFETEDTVRERGKHRQVIVEAHVGYAVFRLKGLRTGYTGSYGGIYQFLVRQAVEKARLEKKSKKK
jgi:hypothetical protein